MPQLRALIDKLAETQRLRPAEYIALLEQRDADSARYLASRARAVAVGSYGHDIYLRGLIELSNYCRNDCYYCGIRRSNRRAERYRMTAEEVLHCCALGYAEGLRTFVLQGGEDPDYDEVHEEGLLALVRAIKERYPDCALTLSLGERSRASYERLYAAGADRYLLRHETADREHYRRLHPAELSLEHRLTCLRELKEIGYQVGAGFMVGAPFQTAETLAADLLYLAELKPHMIGIGPFIHHPDTPFADEPDGSLELTLYCLGILRLMFPAVLLPATTALGTIAGDGRERGVLTGANVIMPNISPPALRSKYRLYAGKLGTDAGEDSVQSAQAAIRANLADIAARMHSIGYETVSARGDYAGWARRATHAE